MDALDSRIIQALLTREATIHDLSKVLSKRDSALRYRIGQLAAEGLVRKRGDGKRSVYFVPLKSITYGKAKLIVTTKGGGTVTLDLGSVFVTERDGLHQVVVLG
jgi:DNA-binding transcriptional ArsR family regulator